MTNRIKAKLILQLSAGGMSGRQIAAAQQISRNSISKVLQSAREKDIAWEDVEQLNDHEVYELLFPEKVHNNFVYPDPDWNYIHKELARVGVTLKRLHAEYRDQCTQEGRPFMGYDRFCKRYKSFTVTKNVVSRVGHKAGRIMEVDWAGPTMALVNPATGEITKVHLFVACLPFSRMSYVEPTLDMKQNTWLLCHVHAFEYFGGSTPCIMCDNLKTRVISHPKEGEVVLNDAYREMANHYNSAVLPVRSSKPRDKASVENGVWQATISVVAELRNEVFSDFQTLKQRVRVVLDSYNSKPFSKRSGTRYQVFAEEEKDLLKPLPVHACEICEWVYGRKVQRNSHICYKHNYYSANYLAIGKTVDLRITESKIEIFLGGQRLATHPLFPAYCRNRYSIYKNDLPEDKTYSDWNSDRIRKWAERIGDNCSGVIERIFQSCRFDEQGFNGALAILRLSHTYGSGRLEAACSIALKTGKRSPRYKDIKPILATNQDKLIEVSQSNHIDDQTGYVRGADFYEDVL